MFRFKTFLGFTPFVVFLSLIIAVMSTPKSAYSQAEIPDEVLDIFDNKCAFSGCHLGASAPQGLDLSEEGAFSTLVNQPSGKKPEFMRVKPQDPVKSYLMMKLKGSAGIDGSRMPKKSPALSDAEIATIESWINALPASAQGVIREAEYTEAFPGLTLATLPTTQTLEKGTFSYRIAHRWQGKVNEGFGRLFGLDAGAHMFTQLTFPVSKLTVWVARSGNNATFEFGGKLRILREKTDGSMPISAAIRAGVDWETLKEILDPGDQNNTNFLDRSSSERFHWFAQVAISKKINERISLLVVPGVLVNGNVSTSDEDAIITLGFAGKLMLFKDFSIFVEGVPIVSGDEGTLPVGGLRRSGAQSTFNDAFTIGLERKIGGHVFHIYITNSLGLATGQYMSGGELDFADGDFRLGFNIYRILRWPF